MKESPLMSIIIPAYNVESFILNCIESIYSQDQENIEVIVIDDGSADKTIEIIKPLETKCNNFIVLTQSNAGVSVARNYGLSVARGKYVYFLDSDDWIENDFFNEIAPICETDQADCIIFGYKKRNASGDFISDKRPWTSGEINSEDQKNSLAKLFVNDNGLAVWDKIIKRSLILENNIKFQNMRNAEDFIFSLDCIKHSKKIYIVNKALYNYRIQISGKRSDNYQLVNNQIIAFRKFNEYFDFVTSQSDEVQNFAKKIFIKWFGLVAPLNIVNFDKITIKQRIKLLDEQTKDALLKTLSKKFSIDNVSLKDKFLLLVIKTQSTLLLYLAGVLLSKARKLYFK
jgi:glycosyltransferase involved in cell wall biosynthesis